MCLVSSGCLYTAAFCLAIGGVAFFLEETVCCALCGDHCLHLPRMSVVAPGFIRVSVHNHIGCHRNSRRFSSDYSHFTFVFFRCRQRRLRETTRHRTQPRGSGSVGVASASVALAVVSSLDTHASTGTSRACSTSHPFMDSAGTSAPPHPAVASLLLRLIRLLTAMPVRPLPAISRLGTAPRLAHGRIGSSVA